MTRCAICRDEIKDGDDVRWEVVGWEKDRKQGGKSPGGTNTIELRRRTGAVAHARCVDKAKRGLVGQLDMLDAL